MFYSGDLLKVALWVIHNLSVGLSKWRLCRLDTAVFQAILVAASSSAEDLQAGNVTGL